MRQSDPTASKEYRALAFTNEHPDFPKVFEHLRDALTPEDRLEGIEWAAEVPSKVRAGGVRSLAEA